MFIYQMNTRLIFSTLFVAAFLHAYSQLPVNGLIARYTFDNHANDKSIFQNNGKINGGVHPTEDRFGNKDGALHFNGTDGFISVANSAELRAPKSSLSICSWIKLEKVNPSANDIHLALLSKSAESTTAQYRFYLKRIFGDLKSTIYNSSESISQDNNYTNHPLEFGQWYFVVLVLDDSWLQLFVNSKLVWVGMSNKLLVPNDAGIEIGRDNIGGTKYFSGCLDDLRIYNRGLTPPEINRLYNDTSTQHPQADLTINLPDNLERNTEDGKCFTRISYSEPTATSSDGSPVELKLTEGFLSGSAFSIGKNTITYQASTSNSTQLRSFIITVVDNEPPRLNCPADIVAEADESLHIAKVDYPAVAAYDNCPDVKLEMISGYRSGYLFPFGVTQIKYRATDATGNMMECGFKITVNEKVKPLKNTEPNAKEVVVPVKQEEEKISPPVKANSYVKEEEALISPMGKITTLHSEDMKPAKREPELKREAAVKIFESETTSIKKEETPIAPVEAKKEISEISKPVPHVSKRATSATLVKSSASKSWHFNCRADTIIHLPENRKGIIYHYSTPTVSNSSSIESIDQTVGTHDGCFLPIGVHPFSFVATDVWGKTQTCTYSVIIKDDLAAAVTVVPQTLEPQLEIGNDAVNYEHNAEVNDCFLTVFIYDDGEEDNDSVSIIFNGQVLVNREMIRVKEHGAIIRKLVLLHDNENYIIAKAWNTGRYGLNTLKLDVYEGDVVQGKKGLMSKKPVLTKVLHSKPGNAGGMILKCK